MLTPGCHISFRACAWKTERTEIRLSGRKRKNQQETIEREWMLEERERNGELGLLSLSDKRLFAAQVLCFHSMDSVMF